MPLQGLWGGVKGLLVSSLLVAPGFGSSLDDPPPVISLDLTGVNHFKYYKSNYGADDMHANHICNKQQDGYPRPELSEGQTHNMCHQSGNDLSDAYSVVCEVLEDKNNCKLPTVKAYDHHDHDVDATYVLRLFIQSQPQQDYTYNGEVVTWKCDGCDHISMPFKCNGCDGCTECCCYEQRGEYVQTNSATDDSNNEAEKLSYSIIMRDKKPPTISYSADAETDAQEACDPLDWAETRRKGGLKNRDSDGPYMLDEGDCGWWGSRKNYHLSTAMTQATDAYDGDVTSRLTINVWRHGEQQATQENDHGNILIDTFAHTGSSNIQYSAEDWAMIFGENNENNVGQAQWDLTFNDTLSSKLHVWPDKGDFHLRDARFLTGYAGEDEHTFASGKTIEDCWAWCWRRQLHAYAGRTQPPSLLQWLQPCIGFDWDETTKACKLFTHQDADWQAGGTIPPNGYVLVQNMPAQPIQNFDYNNYLECTTNVTSYAWISDPGARCMDMRLSATDGSCLDETALEVTKSLDSCDIGGNATCPPSMADIGKAVGTFDVSYSCTNNDESKTRHIQVIDTSPPVLEITTVGQHQLEVQNFATSISENDHRHTNGDYKNLTLVDNILSTDTFDPDNSYVIQHSAGYQKDLAFVQRLQEDQVGYRCVDDCDENPEVTITWSRDGTVVGHFDSLVSGTYQLKYTCCDAASSGAPMQYDRIAESWTGDPQSQSQRCVTQTREIINVDHVKPVINVKGIQHLTLEATQDTHYTDEGAICSDEVDGDISDDIEVSGDVVNLNRVGNYEIYYDCSDAAENDAHQQYRRIEVRDHSCPTCVVKYGPSKIEASFPYKDDGVVCSDDLDGEIGSAEDDPNWASYWAITNNVNVEKTGTYIITYRVHDSAGNYNDFLSNGQPCSPKNQYFRNIVVMDTLKPVVALHYEHNGQTHLIGLTHGKEGSSVNGGFLDTRLTDKNQQKTNPIEDQVRGLFTAEIVGRSPTSVLAFVLCTTAMALIVYAMPRRTSRTLVPV